MNKKLIITLIALVAVGLLVYFLWPSKKSVSFKTQVVEEGTVSKVVTATGYVQPAEEVEVGTQVSGIVKKLYVTYNSKVKKGQVLAELDKSTLLEKLQQANSSKASAESALKLAKQNYERTKALYEAKAATQQSYDEATNTYIQAQNSFSNAQTNVRQVNVDLGYTVITSPIDGIVLDKQVEEGQTVASSFSTPTLFVIARDLKNMHVEADIDEADIGSVNVGQKVTFTVDSYMGVEFKGDVIEVRRKPKVTSNVVTYTVIIKAENPDGKLFPGMTASVSIVTEAQSSTVVPLSALNFQPSQELFDALGKPNKKDMKKGGEGRKKSGEGLSDEERAQRREERRAHMEKSMENGKVVWVKNGNNIMPRPVEIGINDGVNTIVKSGVSVGDTVVLSAQVGEKEKPSQRGQANNPFGMKGPGQRKR